jgi:hypothetical protein
VDNLGSTISHCSSPTAVDAAPRQKHERLILSERFPAPAGTIMISGGGTMARCTEGFTVDLELINRLLTQLQYSRVEAQQLANDRLRQHVTESLTDAIGALRRGQEEVRLAFLRLILTNSGNIESHIAAAETNTPIQPSTEAL